MRSEGQGVRSGALSNENAVPWRVLLQGGFFVFPGRRGVKV